MKHASLGTNYAILTKQVEVQHEKKPDSNFKSMQIVCFDQIPTKFTNFVLTYAKTLCST